MPNIDSTSFMLFAKFIAKSIVYLAGIVAAIYGTMKFIEKIIDEKLKNPEKLKEISRILRPSVIFDNSGSIVADQGAMNFIESIHFEYEDKVDKIPNKIIITPKRFLPLPPLLTSLDNFAFNQSSSRGDKFDWVYNLDLVYSQSDISQFRFRVEILN